MVVVLHDLNLAARYCDDLVLLGDGGIVATGTAAELKSRVGGDTVELHDPQGDLLREVPTDGTVTGLRRALDVLDESGAEGVVTLRRPTLDDVFLALTGDSADPAPGASPVAGTADTTASTPVKEHA